MILIRGLLSSWEEVLCRIVWNIMVMMSFLWPHEDYACSCPKPLETAASLRQSDGLAQHNVVSCVLHFNAKTCCLVAMVARDCEPRVNAFNVDGWCIRNCRDSQVHMIRSQRLRLVSKLDQTAASLTHSSAHSFSLRIWSSSSGVKSFWMLKVLRISSGDLPLIMFATVLQPTSSSALMSR